MSHPSWSAGEDAGDSSDPAARRETDGGYSGSRHSHVDPDDRADPPAATNGPDGGVGDAPDHDALGDGNADSIAAGGDGTGRDDPWAGPGGAGSAAVAADYPSAPPAWEQQPGEWEPGQAGEWQPGPAGEWQPGEWQPGPAGEWQPEQQHVWPAPASGGWPQQQHEQHGGWPQQQPEAWPPQTNEQHGGWPQPQPQPEAWPPPTNEQHGQYEQHGGWPPDQQAGWPASDQQPAWQSGGWPQDQPPFHPVRDDAVPPSGAPAYEAAPLEHPAPSEPTSRPPAPEAPTYVPAQAEPTPRPPQPEAPEFISETPLYSDRLAPAPAPDPAYEPPLPGPTWDASGDDRDLAGARESARERTDAGLPSTSDSRPSNEFAGTAHDGGSGHPAGAAAAATSGDRNDDRPEADPGASSGGSDRTGSSAPRADDRPGGSQPAPWDTVWSPPSSSPEPAAPDAPPGWAPSGPDAGGYEPAGAAASATAPAPRPAAAGPGPEAGHPPGHAQGQGPSAGPIPRPEDLLVSSRPRAMEKPATWGMRGFFGRISGGMYKPKPSAAELADRQSRLNAQRGFSRPMTVVVIQPKGGAGKTPTTICLASALGVRRGGYVVGWDNNETRGTLAVRTANDDNQRTTAWDLLGRLDEFERLDARVGELSYYMRAQGAAQFDALVSDDNPGNMAQIGEIEFRRIHAVLQRFYRMIIVDTGNNVRSPNWQAAVDHADQVVVVSTYQRDVGYSGSWVLDHLAQTGRDALARNAVTVLTAAEPDIDKQVQEELVRHFSARTRAVVEVPYDPHIAEGGPIAWPELSVASQRAWTAAAASVTSALQDSDRKDLAPAGRRPR